MRNRGSRTFLAFAAILAANGAAAECSFNPFIPLIHLECPATGVPAPTREGLWACNEFGERIIVNVASFENAVWTTRGWTEIPNEECRQLSARMNNTRFYLFAVGESGKEWGGNHAFCIASTEFSGADALAFCEPRGGMARGFFSVWVPDMVTGQTPERYVQVIGPNNQNLNHP